MNTPNQARSPIATRYAHFAADFTDTAAAVPADRWSSPSPCPDWTARDVVRHVVESSGYFLGKVGHGLDSGPSADADPLGAFEHMRSVVQACLDDPATASAKYESPMGVQTFEGAVDRFLSTDLVVHRWDLAQAAGLDVRLPDDGIAHVRSSMSGLDESLMRGPNAFGPEVEAPADVDEQTKLLAFLGRRA